MVTQASESEVDGTIESLPWLVDFSNHVIKNLCYVMLVLTVKDRAFQGSILGLAGLELWV